MRRASAPLLLAALLSIQVQAQSKPFWDRWQVHAACAAFDAAGSYGDARTTYIGYKRFDALEANGLLADPTGRPDMRKVIIGKVAIATAAEVVYWKYDRKYGNWIHLANGLAGAIATWHNERAFRFQLKLAF